MTTAKRRRGRPRKEVPRVRLTVVIHPELRRALRWQGVAEDRDLSDIVSESLKAYLRRKRTSAR